MTSTQLIIVNRFFKETLQNGGQKALAKISIHQSLLNEGQRAEIERLAIVGEGNCNYTNLPFAPKRDDPVGLISHALEHMWINEANNAASEQERLPVIGEGFTMTFDPPLPNEEYEAAIIAARIRPLRSGDRFINTLNLEEHLTSAISILEETLTRNRD